MDIDTWVVEYRSPDLDYPLFAVWYTDTDENRTDRLLTFKTGKVFATRSRQALKTAIPAHLSAINTFDKLQPFLTAFDDNTDVILYDVNSIYASVKEGKMDIVTLEMLTNFINLFGDYVEQATENEHLLDYLHAKHIREAWNYFYDNIFWPRFSDSEKFAVWDRPEPEIDTRKLAEELAMMVKQFDIHIQAVSG